jgi:large subunit ribosomal protein L35
MAKTKLKTKRAAAKRYRVTGSGRIKVGKKGHRHILTGKSRKQKNRTCGTRILGKVDEPMAKSLLPYGS